MNEEQVKLFLEEKLNNDSLTEEERKSIEGTIQYLNKKKETSKHKWGKFAKEIKEKKKEWEENYPVKNFDYEFREISIEYPMLFSLSLELQNEEMEQSIFTIDYIAEEDMIYFSSVEEGQHFNQ